jgi:hypothetical protein
MVPQSDGFGIKAALDAEDRAGILAFIDRRVAEAVANERRSITDWIEDNVHGPCSCAGDIHRYILSRGDI